MGTEVVGRRVGGDVSLGACVVGREVVDCDVGVVDGETVDGRAVGVNEGSGVGMRVGARVGRNVGDAVLGALVGAIVEGTAVGVEVVGAADGRAVVGAFVGDGVTTGVGDEVAHGLLTSHLSP